MYNVRVQSDAGSHHCAAARRWNHAINNELRGSGVRCTVVSPGVTTELPEVSGQRPTHYQRTVMMRSADVGAIATRAMLKGRAEVVPGRVNAITASTSRVAPRDMAAAITRGPMT